MKNFKKREIFGLLILALAQLMTSSQRFETIDSAEVVEVVQKEPEIQKEELMWLKEPKLNVFDSFLKHITLRIEKENLANDDTNLPVDDENINITIESDNSIEGIVEDIVSYPDLEVEDEKLELGTENIVDDVFFEVGLGTMLSANSNTKDYVLSQDIMVSNADGYQISDEAKNTLIKAIKDSNKDVAIYVTDPSTKATFTYNPNKIMRPASTVKVGMALAACKKIDSGEIGFNDLVTYESKHYNKGSGLIQYAKLGTQYSVRELIHLCIHESDNIAYYMLTDIVGKENYNAMMEEIGVENLLNEWTSWGNLSARDLNLIWQEIYASDRESGEKLHNIKERDGIVDEAGCSACAILNYELLQAKYNFLEIALPYETSCKSGFIQGAYHGSGVGYTPNGHYIITIMTNGESGDNANKFNKVAQAVDIIITEYSSYKSNQNDVSMEIIE